MCIDPNDDVGLGLLDAKVHAGGGETRGVFDQANARIGFAKFCRDLVGVVFRWAEGEQQLELAGKLLRQNRTNGSFKMLGLVEHRHNDAHRWRFSLRRHDQSSVDVTPV